MLGIVNVVGSTIARESDGGRLRPRRPGDRRRLDEGVHVAADGPCADHAHAGAGAGDVARSDGKVLAEEIDALPDKVAQILRDTDTIRKHRGGVQGRQNFLYLGRGANFPVALEGALKLKEISYIHAEGYPAAEMKHGPIALIDENMPVVVVVPKDAIYEKVMSNIQEVRARQGQDHRRCERGRHADRADWPSTSSASRGRTASSGRSSTSSRCSCWRTTSRWRAGRTWISRGTWRRVSRCEVSTVQRARALRQLIHGDECRLRTPMKHEPRFKPTDWALVLGASSGFGGAAAVELARAGMNIFGDPPRPAGHDADRPARHQGDQAHAAAKRSSSTSTPRTRSSGAETLDEIQERFADTPAHTVRVLLHSLAFGTLKPFIAKKPEDAVTQAQMEMTIDVMANSLVYWTQGLLIRDLMKTGGRIFAMTSSGGHTVLPAYGAVSAAKAALESHIRQLAMELGPLRHHRERGHGGRDRHPGAPEDSRGARTCSEIARAKNPGGPPDHARRRGEGDRPARRRECVLGLRQRHRRRRRRRRRELRRPEGTGIGVGLGA